MPWYVTGVIHYLECDSCFTCHLHNGDPLKRRTVHEPRGRPEFRAPYTWEASAVDALEYDGLDVWTDWSLGGTLWALETYNGFGYRSRCISSPYLWGGTQFYKRGQFTRDGHFDPRAVSHQLGAAIILRAMQKRGLIDLK